MKRKWKAYKVFSIMSVLFLLIGNLTGCQKNSIKPSDDIKPAETESITNPDEFDRSEEQLVLYKEYLEQEKAYQTNIEETRILLENQIDEINIDSQNLQEETGEILGILGRSFSYENYEQLDTDKIYKILDSYSKQEYVKPVLEEKEDQLIFDDLQNAIDTIDTSLPEEELFIIVHNVLQYATNYSPYADQLNWTNWIAAAKKCNYFTPSDVLWKDGKENNVLLTLLGVKTIKAYDHTLGSTVGSNVTINSNQTTYATQSNNRNASKLNDSSTYANNSMYRWVSGTTRTVYISVTGLYKFELTGGGGGTDGTLNGNRGGAGGNVTAYAVLEEGTVLYVNVGGHGLRTAEGGRSKGRQPTWAPGRVEGGYNGGGSAYSYSSNDSYQGQGGSGGGATSIALQNGVLSSVSSDKVLAVAGGGGGSAGVEWPDDTSRGASGGGGGGTTGNRGPRSGGYGGTQTAGGAVGGTGYNPTAGSYGKGGNSNTYSAGGGGGGYYGGGGAGGGQNDYRGGGGGSSYYKYASVTYGGQTYNSSTTAGSNGGSPAGNNAAQTGGGSAKITLVSSKQDMSSPVLTISQNGVVSWTAISGASGYAISMNGSSYTDIGNVTQYDYNSSITAASGNRTVYLKAIGDSSHNDSFGQASVTVYNLTLFGDAGINRTKSGGNWSSDNSSFSRNYIADNSVSIEAEAKSGNVFVKWEIVNP